MKTRLIAICSLFAAAGILLFAGCSNPVTGPAAGGNPAAQAPTARFTDMNGADVAYDAVYDFGTVTAGKSKALTFSIENGGDKDLLITGSTLPPAIFEAEGFETGVIPPGQKRTCTVTFTPVGNGDYAWKAGLAFETNDSDNPGYRVWFTGESVSS